jgi:hypothetical protein
VNEQIDLPRASPIGLESVPLWRVTYQFDALSTLRRVADFHASIAQHFDIDHSVADLKLGVAITNLDLQSAEKAAGTTISIGCNLQNRLSI